MVRNSNSHYTSCCNITCCCCCMSSRIFKPMVTQSKIHNTCSRIIISSRRLECRELTSSNINSESIIMLLNSTIYCRNKLVSVTTKWSLTNIYIKCSISWSFYNTPSIPINWVSLTRICVSCSITIFTTSECYSTFFKSN